MLDDELREQLADLVRPLISLPVPGLRVLRRRTRRRRIGRATTAAAITVVIAAAAVSAAARTSGHDSPRPAAPTRAPASWGAAPGTWTRGVWQSAEPQPAADAGPAVAPYILLPGMERSWELQVRNVFTDKTITTVTPPRGQIVLAAAPAGDDRTFVLETEVAKKFGPPNLDATATFDELRLRPDGQTLWVRTLFTLPGRDAPDEFAISQDASMLAYTTNNSGFETVSLAAGRGRSWAPVDSGTVSPLSLSWAGDRTLAFEWGSGDNRHPPGLGIRLLNVAATGSVLAGSRLAVAYDRYCASAAPGASSSYGGVCLGDPMITPDGSRVIVTKVADHGSGYTDSVTEYSTRTGQLVANVVPPAGPIYPCQPLWTDPSGQQVVSWCQGGVRYDQGRVSPITLHFHMNGTDLLGYAW